MHVLILGQTESGKTTLATRLSKQYRKKNAKVIVLDKFLDPRWDADYITNNRQKFLRIIRHPDTKSCQIFVDESGEEIGQYKSEMFFLATQGRHYGHNVHFIAQRAKQLARTVRDQCGVLFLFNCARTDAYELADDWNCAELKDAYTLKKGEYFCLKRLEKVQKHHLFA